MEYLYDGSFDGLLTCIYRNYYQEAASGIYQQENYQPALMINSTVVVTDPVLAARVYEAIETKISEDALKLIYHTYLSSAANKENLILRYLRLGFRIGPNINLYHSHSDVYPLQKVARQVTLEVHRFLGLLRFADTGRFLYAVLSPDHNILPLIADHFADRLAHERWIIHDQKRKLAVVYDGSAQTHWYLTDFAHHLAEPLPEKEQYYQQLWQLYFHEIAIETRRNPRLQSHFVPLRYRSHLTEFNAPGF
jgi:probable DNA metabolism protein